MANDLDELDSDWVDDWREDGGDHWEDEWTVVKVEKSSPPSTPLPQKPHSQIQQQSIPYVNQANSDKHYVEKIMDKVGHHFSSSSENVYFQTEPMDIPYCYGE